LSETRFVVSDNVITVIVISGIFIGVPVALLLARDWYTRPSKKKIEGGGGGGCPVLVFGIKETLYDKSC
jgi:hypothetical protein